MVGARLYLPEAWLTPDQRRRARIPQTVQFQRKWRLARDAAAAGAREWSDGTAVVADAEFGNNATLRRTLHRAQCSYALGVASDLKVFVGTPVVQAPASQPCTGRPRTRPQLAAGTQAIEARAWAATHAPRQWRRVSWRNGTNPPWRAGFCAIRVTPAHDWRERRLAPEVWLLCERGRIGSRAPGRSGQPATHGHARSNWCTWRISGGRSSSRTKNSRTNSASITSKAARCRAGRKHVVLTALAYAWLQHERRRRAARLPTLPVARAMITEILTAHFFVTHPHDLDTMLKLRQIQLRI